MIKKQTVLIAVFAVLFVLLLVAYLAVIRPLTNTPEETETEPPVETAPGEAVGMADKILVYPYVESKQIQSIAVRNKYGSYRVYRDADDTPQIEGHEGVAFEEEKMSSLMTSIGYPLAITKVGETDDLFEYGLTERTDENGKTVKPATFEMTTKSGEKYNGTIGDKIVTGNGYYFVYDGRPNTVYVLDVTVADTILSPVEVLVSPMIVTPMSQNDYFLVHDFTLMQGDEVKVSFDYIEEKDRKDTEFVTQTYKMLYPQGLIPSAEAISGAMRSLYTAKSDGYMEVVCLGVDDAALKRYNIGGENGGYSLYYLYNDIENFVVISPKNTDGSYYVASSLFQQIVKMDGRALDFLTWDLFDWVEAPFFQMKIDFVKDISVEAGDYSVTYDLKGTGENLTVTERGTGHKPDVTNFRQFYKTLLYASYEGQCNLTADELVAYHAMDDSEAQVILTIHTSGGRELRYRFFRYSERRSYVEFNGTGEFYTLRTMADKILADAKRVQSGEKITSTDKY